MVGLMGLPEFVFLPAMAIGFAFWLWMLIDCASNESRENRVVWVLVIVFVNLLGAIAYYIVRKRQRTAQA
jgi:hypothetical protein